MILKFHSLVNRDVVLNLDPIADLHVRTHVDVLPESAPFSYGCSRLNVAEVPDAGSVSDRHTLVDVGAFVNKKASHQIASVCMLP